MSNDDNLFNIASDQPEELSIHYNSPPPFWVNIVKIAQNPVQLES